MVNKSCLILCLCALGGTLPYYNHGSPAYLSYLSLITNAAAAAAAAAAAGGSAYQPPSQLVPGSPFPSPSSAGCCTPGTRPDVSPSFDFSSPFHPVTTPRLLDLHKGLSPMSTLYVVKKMNNTVEL